MHYLFYTLAADSTPNKISIGVKTKAGGHHINYHSVHKSLQTRLIYCNIIADRSTFQVLPIIGQ